MDNLETKKYELCFWLKDDGSGTAPMAQFDSVKNAVQKAGGLIITEHQPEKRNLAYPIQKQRIGFWCEIVFAGLPEIVAKIKEDFKYEAAILRKLIVVVPPVKEKKERLVKPASPVKTPETEATKPAESPQEMQEQLDSKLKEILES